VQKNFFRSNFRLDAFFRQKVNPFPRARVSNVFIDRFNCPTDSSSSVSCRRKLAQPGEKGTTPTWGRCYGHIFCDFCQFSAEKIAVFLNNQFLQKVAAV
jgi:hypothetical protein